MDNILPVYYRLNYEKLISLKGLNCSHTGEQTNFVIKHASQHRFYFNALINIKPHFKKKISYQLKLQHKVGYHII